MATRRRRPGDDGFGDFDEPSGWGPSPRDPSEPGPGWDAPTDFGSGLSGPTGAGRALLTSFSRYDQLTVRQGTSVTEVVLSWEKRNRYEVYGPTGGLAYFIREVGSGFAELLGRMFLGPSRAARFELTDPASAAVLLRLQKPFRFFLPEMRVETADGEPLGEIRRRFSLVNRVYTVRSVQTGEEVELFGALWKPWTFTLRQGGMEIGKIQKRWRGLGTELLTDADDFGVDMAQVAAPEMRALVFGATLLVDMAHFERNKG